MLKYLSNPNANAPAISRKAEYRLKWVRYFEGRIQVNPNIITSVFVYDMKQKAGFCCVVKVVALGFCV